MKKYLLIAASLFAAAVFAAELTVAELGKSSYAIVIPDHSPCYNVPRMAILLKEGIRQSTGAEIPVVTESKYKGGNAIFIGPVKAAGKLHAMNRHEARIAVRGNNIFLYGSDRKYLHKKDSCTVFYEQGSPRAVAIFMRRFLKAEFLFPGTGTLGLTVEPRKKLTVPGDFKLTDTPVVTYNIGRFHGLYYDVFNGHLTAPWYGEYGGHNYYFAVPKVKYEKTHPEYFGIRDGKRDARYGHLCLSNPDVQRLIHQEVLDHIDRGFEIVELSQTDGYRHCECEKCRNLFGTEKPGEQLWIFHRRIAEAVMKERPGKKLCITSYGPTRQLPESFTTFPSNVVIDLAPWKFDSLEQWKKYSVPGGFVCYDYTFGSYDIMGFTPKRSIAFITKHARNFRRDRLQGIYRSGWGDGFGTDGPFYYIWNRLLQEPELNPYTLLHDYCVRLFGAAAPEMEQFYLLLDKRMQTADKEIMVAEGGDYNDPVLLEKGLVNNPRPVALLLKRWPVKVVLKLQELLDRAEKKLPATENMKFFWPLIKSDFAYFKVTMQTIDAMERVRCNANESNSRDLLKYSQARLDFINALPWDKKGKLPKYGEMLRFAGLPKQGVIDNGRLRGVINFPFQSPVKPFLDNNVIPMGRVMRTGSAPQLLVGSTPVNNARPEIWEHPFYLQTSWTPEALTVKITCPKKMPEKVIRKYKKLQVFVRIFIGQGKKRLRFQGNTGWHNCQPRVAVCGKKGTPGDSYDAPVCTKNFKVEQDKDYNVTFTIPWKETGIIPKKGMKIDFNTFVEYDQIYGMIWEYNPQQRTWRNPCDHAGSLILE